MPRDFNACVESVKKNQSLQCIVLVVVALVVGTIVLIVISFQPVEYYQMGFALSKTTGYVNTDRVYTGGRYAVGPDGTFKTFLKSVHFEKLPLLSVSTGDKLEIGMTSYFQYYLRTHQLGLLHEKFDNKYRPILKSNAQDALKNNAVFYTTREFIRNRTYVEEQIKKAIKDRLSGKCCELHCGQGDSDSCVPNCKTYEECTAEDFGLFAELKAYQMTEVTIPSTVAERFLNALLLLENNEEAKLKQESAVYRQETIKLEKIVSNEAEVILEQANANATLIKKIAIAESKVVIEEARISGLKELYSSLNITNATHQTAFDYIRTLKAKDQNRLAIDFQTYIAGDMAKP